MLTTHTNIFNSWHELLSSTLQDRVIIGKQSNWTGDLRYSLPWQHKIVSLEFKSSILKCKARLGWKFCTNIDMDMQGNSWYNWKNCKVNIMSSICLSIATSKCKQFGALSSILFDAPFICFYVPLPHLRPPVLGFQQKSSWPLHSFKENQIV